MNNASERTVVVLGASDNPDRYSFRALRELVFHGFRAIPVHPHLQTIQGLPVHSSLEAITEPVDTVTIYVSPKHSSAMIDAIVKLNPKRVILNPGAENPDLERALDTAGIPALHACSLVLLSTGRF
uniref:CoA-binding protein n=1 Tax=Gracilinema caldarium TaxID=215591 RepID=A0A7C3E8G9_9SPIR